MIIVPIISDFFSKQYNIETSIVWSVDKLILFWAPWKYWRLNKRAPSFGLILIMCCLRHLGHSLKKNEVT
jgi:hypothetical protein